MRRMLVFLAIGCFLLNTAGYVHAKGTAAEAKAMVEKAAAFMKANGQEKTFAEINNKKGQFVKDDLYVYACDIKGLTLAHGANEKLIGRDFSDLKDADGKLFMREVMEGAKAKGSGWCDYKWTNPLTKNLEHKSAYFLRVGDVILMCGIYKK